MFAGAKAFGESQTTAELRLVLGAMDVMTLGYSEWYGYARWLGFWEEFYWMRHSLSQWRCEWI